MQCQVFSCRWFYLFLFLCSEVIRTIPNASHLWVRGVRSKNIFQSWGFWTKSMLSFYDLHKVSNCRDLGQEFFGTFTCNCDQWGSCFKEISQVTNVPRLLEKPRKADSLDTQQANRGPETSAQMYSGWLVYENGINVLFFLNFHCDCFVKTSPRF